VCVQNNVNYSSLAILSRCPQAPVPNLGQYDHQLIASAVPGEGRNDASHISTTTDHQHGAADDSSVTDVSSSVAAPRSTYPQTPSFGVPASTNVPVSGVSPVCGPTSVAVSDHRVTDLSSSRGTFVATVDDDFDDFKTAPATYTSPAGHLVPNSRDTMSG